MGGGSAAVALKREKEPPEVGSSSLAKSSPLSASREMTNLRDQLDQQQQQTRQVLAQLMLVREQLISETNARMEAQARIQQLLQQNRELLEHIASLGGYHEPDRPGLSATAIGIAPQVREGYPFIRTHPLDPGPSAKSPTRRFERLSHAKPFISLENRLAVRLQSLAGLVPPTAPNNPLAAQQELYKLNQTLLTQLSGGTYPGAFYPNAIPTSIAATGVTPGGVATGVPNFMFTNPSAAGYGAGLAGGTSSKPPSADSSSKNSPTATSSGSGRLIGGSGGGFLPDTGQRSNRPSYASSTSTLFDELRLARSLEKGMESLRMDDDGSSSPFIKPLSQVGTLTTIDPDGKVKVVVPINPNEQTGSPTSQTHQQQQQHHQHQQQQLDIPAVGPSRKSASFSELPTGTSGSSGTSGTASQEGSTRNVSILKDSTRSKTSIPSLVTLKVTDESGTTVMRKLPATPSFITRSTSEKVPNRSQIMSQVQRTQWARHTTK
uniref:Uncharacterized protein n=1 Tax=Anopheles epiroticus TaxID=199890 RepID=A0A182P3K0_9DIPT